MGKGEREREGEAEIYNSPFFSLSLSLKKGISQFFQNKKGNIRSFWTREEGRGVLRRQYKPVVRSIISFHQLASHTNNFFLSNATYAAASGDYKLQIFRFFRPQPSFFSLFLCVCLSWASSDSRADISSLKRSSSSSLSLPPPISPSSTLSAPSYLSHTHTINTHTHTINIATQKERKKKRKKMHMKKTKEEEEEKRTKFHPVQSILHYAL